MVWVLTNTLSESINRIYENPGYRDVIIYIRSDNIIYPYIIAWVTRDNELDGIIGRSGDLFVYSPLYGGIVSKQSIIDGKLELKQFQKEMKV